MRRETASFLVHANSKLPSIPLHGECLLEREADNELDTERKGKTQPH